MNTDGLSPRTRALGAAAKVFAVGAMLALLILTSLAVFRLERLERASAVEQTLIADAAELLIECTTSPGDRTPPVYSASPTDCYLRGELRTAAAVARVKELTVIASACGAANPGDVPATRQCVEKALNNEETP